MTKTIPLAKGHSTTVDDEDYDDLVLYKWRCTIWKDGTVNACRVKREDGKQRTVLMHREITKAPDGKVVDHKDGDTLNNTRANLRVCTKSENNMNKGVAKNNTSGIRGVSWNKRQKKWEAKIKLNRRTRHLGCFKDINDAAEARRQAEEELFGEFSYRNSRSL